MKKFTLMLTGSVLLLSGCTGMKSEFDCTETAQNGCLTMDEANNRARMKTETEKQNIRLPPLAEVRAATVTAPALRASSARAPVATTS
ncbi:TraV family lipoprotein, partial [Salmonella enterica]|nr:TraV family lipoprotein [Salmonella enterica]